jgi:hypothetical protein
MATGVSIANDINWNASCNYIGQSVGSHWPSMYSGSVARHRFTVDADGPSIDDHIVDAGSNFASAGICIAYSVDCWHDIIL